MIHYEDLKPDLHETHGSTTVTAAAITRFAERYDPQPFHLSDADARNTPFGALAASGWHTTALTLQLFTGQRREPLASLGSPGFDDLRWPRPVLASDTLRVQS